MRLGHSLVSQTFTRKGACSVGGGVTVPSNTDLSQSHGEEQVDSDSISNATGPGDDISSPNSNNVSNYVPSQD
jgi:hypothetical protein